jgi:hypothetical protein
VNFHFATFATLLLFSLAQAGEIVIIQPASKDSRTEKEAARSSEKARQRSGKQAGPIIVEDGSLDGGSKAQRSSQDAQWITSPGGREDDHHPAQRPSQRRREITTKSGFLCPASQFFGNQSCLWRRFSDRRHSWRQACGRSQRDCQRTRQLSR